MFISALFTIAKKWKQLKCPSTDEKVKVLCVCVHTHTMEYYSAIKENEILPFVTTWMNLEGITLSKISQTEKTTTIGFHLYIESTKQNKQI